MLVLMMVGSALKMEAAYNILMFNISKFVFPSVPFCVLQTAVHKKGFLKFCLSCSEIYEILSFRGGGNVDCGITGCRRSVVPPVLHL